MAESNEPLSTAYIVLDNFFFQYLVHRSLEQTLELVTEDVYLVSTGTAKQCRAGRTLHTCWKWSFRKCLPQCRS